MDLLDVSTFERDHVNATDRSFSFHNFDSFTPEFDLASSDMQAFPSGGDYPITLAGSGYDRPNNRDEEFINTPEDFRNNSSPGYSEALDYSIVNVNSMEGHIDMSYKPNMILEEVSDSTTAIHDHDEFGFFNTIDTTLSPTLNIISNSNNNNHHHNSNNINNIDNPSSSITSGHSSVKSSDSVISDDSDLTNTDKPKRRARNEYVSQKLIRSTNSLRPVLTSQKSVLVVGREFDQPEAIAHILEKRFYDIFHEHGILFESLPVTPSKLLASDPKKIIEEKFDSILLCYNSTEARLMVTSEGGFYSTILPHALSMLGINKVMLAFTHCETPTSTDIEHNLLSRDLHDRIMLQPHMAPLSQFQTIFSWSQEPNEHHIMKINDIIKQQAIFSSNKKNCKII